MLGGKPSWNVLRKIPWETPARGFEEVVDGVDLLGTILDGVDCLGVVLDGSDGVTRMLRRRSWVALMWLRGLYRGDLERL